MLNRDDPRPPYVQIAELLGADIAAGDYPPGGRLPGKSALIERFGVAGATINRAIDVLKRDGLVVGRQGQGTFVVATPKAPAATRLELIEARVAELERQVEALTNGAASVTAHVPIPETAGAAHASTRDDGYPAMWTGGTE